MIDSKRTIATALIVACLVLVLPGLATAQASDSGDQASAPDSISELTIYLKLAAEHNPRLRAAFYRWHASEARAGYVGGLPDPTLAYAYFVEQVETRVGPQNHRLSLRQTIPWFGSLGAKKNTAALAARAEFEKFNAEWLELEHDVRIAYYRLYYLERDISITRENLELLVFWEEVVRTRYKVALTQHPDVIRAQVELGKLENRLQQLEGMREPVTTRLRNLLNLPAQPHLTTIDSLTPIERSLPADSVRHLMTSTNPHLVAVARSIDRARAEQTAVARDRLPDFTLGVDYIVTGDAIDPSLPESGKDPWTVSVGFNLPLWFGKNSAKTREATARLKQTEYEYDALENDLRNTISQALFEHADALRRVRLYRSGLIPKAEQAVNVTYKSYQAGESDFLSLLDAQRQLLEFSRDHERAVTDLAISLAQIDLLTGNRSANIEIEEAGFEEGE